MRYKTYRCVYQIKQVDIDQYGAEEQGTAKVLATFDTREEANGALSNYAKRRFPDLSRYDSWIPLKPAHAYQKIYVTYREELAKEWEE